VIKFYSLKARHALHALHSLTLLSCVAARWVLHATR